MKSHQELRVSTICNITNQTIHFEPLCEKLIKFHAFSQERGNLNQNRTDLSLVCDLNNEESVFGLDLRNSTLHITQLF